jgi:hypothetical protein
MVDGHRPTVGRGDRAAIVVDHVSEGVHGDDAEEHRTEQERPRERTTRTSRPDSACCPRGIGMLTVAHQEAR